METINRGFHTDSTGSRRFTCGLCSQPDGHDPGAAARPHGGHPAAGIHARREGAHRQVREEGMACGVDLEASRRSGWAVHPCQAPLDPCCSGSPNGVNLRWVVVDLLAEQAVPDPEAAGGQRPGGEASDRHARGHRPHRQRLHQRGRRAAGESSRQSLVQTLLAFACDASLTAFSLCVWPAGGA